MHCVTCLYWGHTSPKAMQIYGIHRLILFIHHGLTILIARLQNKFGWSKTKKFAAKIWLQKKKSSQFFRDFSAYMSHIPTLGFQQWYCCLLDQQTIDRLSLTKKLRMLGWEKLDGQTPLLCSRLMGKYVDASENSGFSPQIIHGLIGFSIINHPIWGTLIFGNTHMSNICNICRVW